MRSCPHCGGDLGYTSFSRCPYCGKSLLSQSISVESSTPQLAEEKISSQKTINTIEDNKIKEKVLPQEELIPEKVARAQFKFCPFCGASLQIQGSRFCPSCGAELSKSQDSAQKYDVRNPKLEEQTQEARESTENTINTYFNLANSAKSVKNYKESYEYFNKILELEPCNSIAWLGKGESAGWLSTTKEFRLSDLRLGVKNAVDYSVPDKQNEIKIQSARIINNISIACWQISLNLVVQAGTLEPVREHFYQGCKEIIKTLELGNNYDPTNKQIVENIIFILKEQIKGVKVKAYFGTRIPAHITPEYEQTLRSKLNEYEEKMKIIDPLYKPETK